MKPEQCGQQPGSAGSRMSPNDLALIGYWRDSVADADLLTIDPRMEGLFRVAPAILQQGQLDPSLTKKLFEAQRAANERGTGSETPGSSDRTLRLILAPIVARRRYTRGRRDYGPSEIYPLLIPAQLAEDGTLAPLFDNKPSPPWIPRTLLEPTTSHLILGDVQALDDFLTGKQLQIDSGASGKWPILWKYGREMLEAVAGRQWQQLLSQSGYQVVDESLVIDDDQLRGMGQNILRVYEWMLANKTVPPLLAAYLNTYPQRPQAALLPEQWLEPARRHLGSFQKDFPLSPSQREALYHFLQLPQQTVLAVSGPPGTGKTTLLHSVIASLMVEAALAQKQPPVMVVSSTNNQAVTNVLDSLHHVADAERWIDVPGFGLYLTNDPQKRREAEQRGIPTTNRWDDGFPAAMETWEFVAEAEYEFLRRCADYLGRPVPSPDSAVRGIHEALLRKAQPFYAGIDAAYAVVQLRKKLDELDRTTGGRDEARMSIQQELDNARSRLADVDEKWARWVQFTAAEPFQDHFLSFLPGVRQKRLDRQLHFLSKHLPELAGQPDSAVIRRTLASWQREAQEAVARCQSQLEELERLPAELTRAQQSWRAWTAQQKASHLAIEDLFEPELTGGDPNPRSLFNWLDTHLRHELFSLATHYWEARWLQEVRQAGVIRDGNRPSQTRDAQEAKWRRYAMLLPCFVTTMHSGPGFFDYFTGQSEPLDSFIDLLVVDEAGQVSPEVSGAMFALARQVLVVGDVRQIEPVWSVPEPVDEGNARRRLSRPFDALRLQGATASSGSAMLMAQHVSPYRLDSSQNSQRGMFLAEHRRSVPEIIEYCNRLAYGGRLRKMRPSIANYPWPHMGYVHVKGESERRGGSRQNLREATTLVAWLAENRETLEAYYEKPVDDVVGIITPFAAQREILLKTLREHKLTIGKVGTVHALQGGERPVILFSTVYTSRDSGPYFFDRGVNMLNVAVSRARDSFLVFGDMDILDPAARTPSGLLARFLFPKVENEIVDARITERQPVEPIHLVNTLDRHVKTLQRAFERAQERLIIVSPYLRWRAVEADNLSEATSAATARGVKVKIYVDDEFNRGLTHPSAAQAASALRASGASLTVCHNIHSKIICVDDAVFIEGSFNWLSAERTLDEYRRLETSFIYMGPQVADYIAQTIRDLERHLKQEGERCERPT